MGPPKINIIHITRQRTTNFQTGDKCKGKGKGKGEGKGKG